MTNDAVDMGQCPFLKQECIKGRCTFWAGMPVVQPSPIASHGKVGKAMGCVFNLILFQLAGSPADPPKSSDDSDARKN